MGFASLRGSIAGVAAAAAAGGRTLLRKVSSRLQGAPENRPERGSPGREAMRASLDGYLANGAKLRRRLRGKVAGRTAPLSQALQEELYDERGLPK